MVGKVSSSSSWGEPRFGAPLENKPNQVNKQKEKDAGISPFKNADSKQMTASFKKEGGPTDTPPGDPKVHKEMYAQLKAIAEKPPKEFEKFITDTFNGGNPDLRFIGRSEVQKLQQDIRNGTFASSTSEVLLGEAEGFNGAFMGGENGEKEQILLNKNLQPKDMAATYWEELGHAIDKRIRPSGGDAKGDEGAIFAKSLEAKSKSSELTESELQALRDEKDNGTISSNGQLIDVEFGSCTSCELGAHDGVKHDTSSVAYYLESVGLTDFISKYNAEVEPSYTMGGFNEPPATVKHVDNGFQSGEYIGSVVKSLGWDYDGIAQTLNVNGQNIKLQISGEASALITDDSNLLGSYDHNSKILKIPESIFQNFADQRAKLQNKDADALKDFDESVRLELATTLVHEVTHALQSNEISPEYVDIYTGHLELSAHVAEANFLSQWINLKGKPNANVVSSSSPSSSMSTFDKLYGMQLEFEKDQLSEAPGDYFNSFKSIVGTDVGTTAGPSVSTRILPPTAAEKSILHSSLDSRVQQAVDPDTGLPLVDSFGSHLESLISGGVAAGEDAQSIRATVDTAMKSQSSKLGSAYEKAWQGVLAQADEDTPTGNAVKALVSFAENEGKNVSGALETLGLAMGAEQLAEGIYADMLRGDDKPTETLQKAGEIGGGVAGAALGEETGAVIGGTIGSVVPGAGTSIGAWLGATAGALGGGYLGSKAGGLTVEVIEEKMGLIKAPPPGSGTSSQSIDDPAYDARVFPNKEATVKHFGLADELRSAVGKKDDGPSDAWYNDFMATHNPNNDATFNERLAYAMYNGEGENTTGVNNAEFWLGAYHGRRFTSPINNLAHWAIKNTSDSGATGVGSMVDTMFKLANNLSNNELDLVQQNWFDPLSDADKEKFYDLATARYGKQWFDLEGTREGTQFGIMTGQEVANRLSSFSEAKLANVGKN